MVLFIVSAKKLQLKAIVLVYSNATVLPCTVLSWRKPLLRRNQSIDFFWKSVDWFLFDRDL